MIVDTSPSFLLRRVSGHTNFSCLVYAQRGGGGKVVVNRGYQNRRGIGHLFSRFKTSMGVVSICSSSCGRSGCVFSLTANGYCRVRGNREMGFGCGSGCNSGWVRGGGPREVVVPVLVTILTILYVINNACCVGICGPTVGRTTRRSALITRGSDAPRGANRHALLTRVGRDGLTLCGSNSCVVLSRSKRRARCSS